jgi:hypothetical protein
VSIHIYSPPLRLMAMNVVGWWEQGRMECSISVLISSPERWWWWWWKNSLFSQERNQFISSSHPPTALKTEREDSC